MFKIETTQFINFVVRSQRVESISSINGEEQELKLKEKR